MLLDIKIVFTSEYLICQVFYVETRKYKIILLGAVSQNHMMDWSPPLISSLSLSLISSLGARRSGSMQITEIDNHLLDKRFLLESEGATSEWAK
ncbi:hypothetical protein L6452_00066 [Arctium lappa]|uniref:Uncharacterized protein n=1 Tax=Arctium lappa TaxID=4217 RepID=A0ACB9FDM9_ARCLA|nr:hypothetical protein L6452_00066 [Arctium lappa]